jgi:plasmid stability protein
MARKMADCRRFESESSCTLTIIGEEDEVVEAAAQHAAAVHGHQDSPEMRQQLRAMLESEQSYTPGARTPEPFPAG